MNIDQGLKEIDEAQWTLDEWGVLNIFTHDQQGRKIHSWLMLRPHYCDRGHIQLVVDGHLNLDGQDSFPRYFFSLEEADAHCRTFLKWRVWQHRVIPDSEIVASWWTR